MSATRRMALLIAAVIGAVPVAAWSQIDTIVVTTRKREENLQDVPIAVTAITAEQIQRQGVADLDDIVQDDPSVLFDRSFGPGDTRITIRGLSNTRGRSNVAFLVDGIDVTTENLTTSGSGLLANRRLLTDVQRIEIVKGPQSALYGRAAFAGAINYITKDPGDVFEGTARMDFASDGFQQVDGAVGGPISDTFGLRMTGFWYNQDGHYVNAMSGEDVGGSAGSGAALTGVWTPTDAVRIKMRGEYSSEDYDPLANIRIGGTWQNAPGVKLFEYPDAVLQNARDRLAGIVTLNGLGATTSGDNTALIDLNQYCPDELKDAGRNPGICLPTTYGSADGRIVKHSEDPLTGRDFDGSDLQTFRFSIVSTIDADFGVFTSLTGWTNFEGRDHFDQDWQAESDYKFTPPGGTTAFSVPDTPSPDFYDGRRADQLTSSQMANTVSEVNQLSQEFRFSSKLDGPFNFTLGALYWDEVRQLEDRNAIVACMPLDKVGVLAYDSLTGTFSFPEFYYQDSNLGNGGNTVGNVCDGGPGPAGFPTTIGWQEYYRQLQNQPGQAGYPGQKAAYWEADTRHWSIYFNLAFELAEDWTLDLEDRFVSESFRLQKPNQSTCTTLGYVATIGQSLRAEQDGVYDAVCAYQEITSDMAGLPDGAFLDGNDTVRLLQATTSSHFNTPKATLRWQLTPDNQLYFYWARAQKPGGINQSTSGGGATTASDERFDPEKLEAWELGSKNTFEVGGPLRANVAFFFQDYTDKQINTQVVNSAGLLQPRVLNASGAEVWGAEFDFTWQPEFLAGLSLSLAYTYLDAQYTEFFDNVTSLQRLAYAGKDCTIVYLAGAPSCRLNYDGKQLERTPENAVALGAGYQRPLLDNGLDLLAEVNAAWQDERFLEPENGLAFEAYWNVDARIGLISPRYEVIAYVDNLLDDDTIKSGGSGPDFGRQVAEAGFTAGLGVSHYIGTLPDPRVFGIRASYKFGEVE